MELLFIPAKSNEKISFSGLKIDGKIGVVTTIQHLEQARKACGKNFVFGGQILGCNFNNAIKMKNKVDKYLYVGTGQFHPIGLALNTGKEVYILNPMSRQFYMLDKNDIARYENRRKGALLKFLNARQVGLLITLKLGQYTPGKYTGIKEKLKQAEKIKELYPSKHFYVLIFNTLRKEDLENFKGIECWANMACPRIVDDYDGIVNIKDVLAASKKKARR